VQAAREAARRIQCTNNLSQVALAIQNYNMAHFVYPPGTVNDEGPIKSVAEGYHHNWISQVLPYLEETNAYLHIDFDAGVYDDSNAEVRRFQIATFECPSSPTARATVGYSDYAGCHHPGETPIDVDNLGVFFLNSAVRYEDVTDGSSYTIFVGEKVTEDERTLGWMSGTRATLRNTGTPINEDLERSRRAEATESPVDKSKLFVGGFSSHHPGGANFAYGDGHVSFLSENADPETLEQLAHRADGELVSSDDR